MKKVLFSLLLAIACMPVFAQIDAAPIIKTVEEVRCTPFTWDITGETYSHDTVIMVNEPAAHNDTVYILNLTINPDGIIRDTVEATAKCVYIWRDSLVWRKSGLDSAIVSATSGCDSIHYINLTITGGHDTSFTTISACDKYMSAWGELFTTDTIIDTTYDYIIDTATNTRCYRRDTLTLTINRSYISDLMVVESDCSYKWRGRTITDNLIHYDTTPTTGNCDSILRIRVNMSFHTDTNYGEIYCGDYFAPWDSTHTTAYSESSTIVHHDTSSTGCIHTTTINLTIDPSFVENKDTLITVCPGTIYTWHPDGGGVHQVDTTGVYTDSSINNVTSCKIEYTLNLSVGDSIVNFVRPVRCEYDSIKIGSTRYSFRIENGDTIVRKFTGSANRPTINIINKDSIFVYNASRQCSTFYRYKLNIVPLGDRSYYDTVVACERYAYARMNITFTQNVDTSFADTMITRTPDLVTYPGFNDHDTIGNCYKKGISLKLTIKDPGFRTDSVEACDKYRWAYNDSIYTNSIEIRRKSTVDGDTTSEGCPIYHKLVLQIINTPETHISGDWMLEPDGSTTLRAVSAESGLEYTWYKNNVMQPGHEETLTVTDEYDHENIDIMLTAANGNGCPDSNWVTITFAAIGIDDVNGIDVNIYPNPASRIVNLRTAEAISTVSVYNAIGQQVMLRQGNGNDMQIDLYNLANGHYTMRIVTTEGHVAIRKFIVSK